MKKIVIELDYQCYPMWIYDNELVENDLVDELKNDKLIDEKLIDIQNKYDALFIDNGIEFSYRGFINNEEKEKFKQQVCEAILYITRMLDDGYIIENAINFEKL